MLRLRKTHISLTPQFWILNTKGFLYACDDDVALLVSHGCQETHLPLGPCSELRDARFCKVGAFVRSKLLFALKLGVLRKGLFGGSGWSDIGPFLCFGGLKGDETGEDAGSAVAAAVPSERRCKPSESAVP